MEREWSTAAPIRWDQEEDARIREQLRALGYM